MEKLHIFLQFHTTSASGRAIVTEYEWTIWQINGKKACQIISISFNLILGGRHRVGCLSPYLVLMPLVLILDFSSLENVQNNNETTEFFILRLNE